MLESSYPVGNHSPLSFEKLLVSSTLHQAFSSLSFEGFESFFSCFGCNIYESSQIKIQGKFEFYGKICPNKAAHISFRIFFSRLKSLHLYRTINKIPSFLYISCTKICKNFPFTIIQVCQKKTTFSLSILKQHDFCTIHLT